MAKSIPNFNPARQASARAKANPFFKPPTAARVVSDKTIQEFRARFMPHWNAGDYAQARRIADDCIRQHPQAAIAWHDAVACSVRLEDWDKVIEYGEQAYRRDPEIIATLTSLSHAYGRQGDLVKARRYGHLVLAKRDALFANKFFCPWQVAAPPAFSQDRSHNLIAFSLFGDNPKYCEAGILNAVEQPALYPDWTCRFYVDETVPAQVLARLTALGAQVVAVDDALRQWPGPMWRFAAYDDPHVDRVIFRDADSVISTREAGAVQEWVASGQAFHAMRDYGSHTDLLLAGMWGVARGALPPMHGMVADYLRVPPPSAHLADQDFLRRYVWPYARQHILQHDSVFDFMHPRPFPEGPQQKNFHVGCVDATFSFERAVHRPDGTRVCWRMVDRSAAPEREVCRYASIVRAGKISANLPNRYLLCLNKKDFVIRIEEQARSTPLK